MEFLKDVAIGVNIIALVYMVWVLIAWALIFILTSFGASVTVSAWVLAIPLAIVAGLFTKNK